jgi:hypothetical protein
MGFGYLVGFYKSKLVGFQVLLLVFQVGFMPETLPAEKRKAFSWRRDNPLAYYWACAKLCAEDPVKVRRAWATAPSPCRPLVLCSRLRMKYAGRSP